MATTAPSGDSLISNLPTAAALNSTEYLPMDQTINGVNGPTTTTVKISSTTLASQILSTNNIITPQAYGAKGDGVTDDSAAVLAASTAAAARGISMILVSKYFIGSSITLPSNIETTGGQLIWSGTTTVTINGKCILTDEQTAFSYPSTAHIALTADTFTSMGWFAIKNDGSQDCTYVIQDLVNSAGSLSRSITFPAGTYACSNSVISYNHQFDGYGFLKMGPDTIPAGKVVNTSFQMSIPTNFTNPGSCLYYLQNRFLSDGVTVTCKIADGTYTWPQTYMQHPQGNRIQIIGNQTTPANVVVQFDATNFNSGFQASYGYALGLLDGMTITTTNAWISHGNWNSAIIPYGAGIIALYDGNINVGAHVIVTKCYYGIKAAYGGSINCAPGVSVTEAGDVAYHAFHDGSINALGCYAQGTYDAAFGIGYGFLGEMGGTIHAENATSSYNYLHGFAAISTGSVWAQKSSSHNNNQAGYFAQEGGHVNASSPSNVTGSPTLSTANRWGARAYQGGTVEFFSSTASNNSSDGLSCNGGVIVADGATSTGNTGAGQVARCNGLVYGTITSTGNGVADFAQEGGIINADET